MQQDTVEPSLTPDVTTPIVQPSASYSITMRVHLPQRPGSFAKVAAAIGETGAILGAIEATAASAGLPAG